MNELFVAKLQTAPARAPMITEAHGYTKPDEGVAATRPAIVPEQKPTIVHRRSIRKSNKHQTAPPKAAAIIVFQMAMTARRFAPNALPPLKPSQPNHRRDAGTLLIHFRGRLRYLLPSPTIETLCGRKFRSSFSDRRPNTHENARPPTPLPISTGPPPIYESRSQLL